MKTFRYKEFEIYKEAKIFRKAVRSALKKLPAEEKYCLVHQGNKAALSIILNIAEGSAKKSDADFARFLEISIGSLNEVAAGLDVAFDDNYLSKAECMAIEEKAEVLAKKIGSFIKVLRNSN